MSRVPGERLLLWSDEDPKRLERDRQEIGAFAPLMQFSEPGANLMHPHGSWAGEIPRWPFSRDEPAGLDSLLGDSQFEVRMEYPSAYPMTPPRLYPANVQPELEEHSQGVWHVSPDGSLCLLQSTGGWTPEASATEMLMKASGWRIEYALMKVGAIIEMTTNGIVSDTVHDALIAGLANSPIANADTEPSN